MPTYNYNKVNSASKLKTSSGSIKPEIKFNSENQSWEYTNDGSTYLPITYREEDTIRTVVFSVSGNIQLSTYGPICFPKNGRLTNIIAMCNIHGTLGNTEIAIEKANYDNYMSEIWSSVVDTNLIISPNKKTNELNFNIILPNVTANDYFRIKILSLSEGAKNITVQLQIE